MKKSLFLPLFSLGLAVSTAALAEIQDEELNTIYITEGRTVITNEETPSTFVFTQTDIEQSAADSLQALLGKVPGISFSSNGGIRGAVSSINIRGTESDQVLVLIDGVRTSSATAGTTALQFIPLVQIERIEVIKGSVSSIYGADAIGGVIKIFTKKGKNQYGGYAEFGLGSHKTRSVALGFNDQVKDFYFGANISMLATDGIDRKVNSQGVNLDDDGFDENNLSLNTGYEGNSPFTFDISYLVNEGNTEFDSFTGAIDDSTDFKSEVVKLSTTTKLSPVVNLIAETSQFKDEQETFGSNTSLYNTKRQQNIGYLQINPIDSHSFVVGAEKYKDKVFSSDDFARTSVSNSANFFEYSNKLKYVNMNLSFRKDSHETYGDNNTERLLISVPIAKNQFLSYSFSTGFKAPTFNDLYFPLNFGFQGNPNLKAEESISRELSYSIKEGFYGLGLTFYQTDIKNLITLLDDFSTVENINRAKIEGGELSLSYIDSSYYLSMVISHVDAVNTETGNQLIRRPKNTLLVSADKYFNNYLIGVEVIAEDGRSQSNDGVRRTSGFGVVNLKSVYDIDQSNQLRMTINNFFDKEYERLENFSTEGFNFQLAYQYRF